MRPLVLALIVVFAGPLLDPGAAHAKNWPKPAAGESASGAPEVILTFDDGPDHRYTPLVLEILRERDIQAVFFWVGRQIDQHRKRADERRAVATRAVLEGHIVGTHTDNHAHLCSLRRTEGAAEIDNAIAAYAALTGLPMILFRAPYGDHCNRLISLLQERHIDHTHWDMDPREWLDHDPKRVANYFIGQLKHLDGRAVIIMHDTKLVTIDALKLMLDWIDSENIRRRRNGQPAIRILKASDWIAERIDPALEQFTVEVSTLASERLIDASHRLIPGYPQRVVTRSP